MTNADVLLGRQFGSYKITAHLSRGGMADVYLAEDVNLRRQVVLKIMLAHLSQNEAFIARFQREARTTARLSHPTIIQVYSTDLLPDGRPYLAMQYIRGGNLHEELTRLAAQGKILPTARALTVMRQVADALGVAHNAGIVHRDLKPSNILLREDGTSVLTDLGIAAVESTTRLTQTGEVMGTPFYMSPEQAQGKPLDGRSDIYSLGVILYEMLAGDPPFQATSPLAVLHQHIYEPPPLLLNQRQDLSPVTSQVVEICLRKNPDQRYQSAALLVAALDRALAAETGAATPPYGQPIADTVVEPAIVPPLPPVDPQTAPQGHGGRRWGWLLLLPLLLLACLAAVWLAREPVMRILGMAPVPAVVVVTGTASPMISPTVTQALPTATPSVTAAPTNTITPSATPTDTPSATPPPPLASAPGEIVFNSNRDGDHEIYIMGPDGGNQRQLTSNNADDEYANISPDGRQIAFQSDRDRNLEIYVMNIDGSGQRRLTTYAGTDRLPSWSPDGRQIAFISERSGSPNVHIMDAEGNNVRRLTSRTGYVGHPSWSIDDQITFNAGGDDGGTWELYVVDRDGSNQRQLTDNTVSDWSPEFSPDGRQILYLHSLSRDDEAAIFVMDADGSNARLLYNSADYEWGQDWSPDGRRILFTREIGNVSYIYRMDADGSNVNFISDRGRYPKEVP